MTLLKYQSLFKMSPVIYVVWFAAALSLGPATKTGDQSHKSIHGLKVTHLPDGNSINGPEDLRQIVNGSEDFEANCGNLGCFVTLKHPSLD